MKLASKYYDLFASKDDIEFYRELALNHERKALELSVGTGRIASKSIIETILKNVGFEVNKVYSAFDKTP